MVMLNVMALFATMITAVMMGSSVYRDFETNTHALFYTTPISKVGYLLGRFIGALIAVLYVHLSIGIAFFLALYLPGIDQDKLGAFNFLAYIQPYFLLIIPNILFTGAIFFTAATLTRNMLTSYVGGMLFIVLYFASSALLADLDNETLSALLDPFGSQAIDNLTRYWTVADKNTQLISLDGLLLTNRLIWVGIGLGLFAFTYFKFTFRQSIVRRTSRKERLARIFNQTVTTDQKLVLPSVRYTFTLANTLKQYISLTKQEFTGTIKSIYFIAIVLVGFLYILMVGTQVGSLYGTTVFPVTYSILNLIGGSFTIFILIITIFYSGEMIWRERTVGIDQITDALPIPTWLPFCSKLSALLLIEVVLVLAIIPAGMIIQIAYGYFNFEPLLYFKGLFGVRLIDHLLLVVLSMTIQVLVNNKYLGYVIVIVYYFLNNFLPAFGLEHNLYQFASNTGIPYSDMNKYGHFVWPYFIFKAYWGMFAIILAILSNLFWVRGTNNDFKTRWYLAKQRLTKPVVLVFGLGFIFFISTGSYIFYNTNILNEYQSSQEIEEETVQYEKKYKQYQGIPQPRITDVNVNVDLYPNEQNAYIRGTYVLKNKTEYPIDSVHINMPSTVDINAMEFSRATTEVVHDKRLGYYIYELAQPFMPGDTMQLAFDIATIAKGFSNGGVRSSIVHNGTFINSNLFPHFGYSANAELLDDDQRKEHGLAPKERMAKITDSLARMNTYISQDADWVTFETIVSTVEDQIAIAPGYEQKEWIQNGRRYFHYKMDSKILNFYSFLSARYEVKRDKWYGPNGEAVDLEIYYHPGHEYNLDRMMKGMKLSLDYFTQNFSPYQHRQARIIEFPRYASFAQSFPNTIPFSEAIGFIADVDEDDPDDLDYPFYVTAHEIAHQWWAHQVIGADVQGSVLMSETLSQYSALMVMEKAYGKDHMKRFLRYEMDQYLRGRGSERKKELPLLLVENQGYIHYNKGSIVMYALKDYIGEDSLNAALSRYIADVAFQEPPYTTSLEFLKYIRQVTPDSLTYLLKDMFATITLYDNKTNEVQYHQREDGKYEVQLSVDSRKYRADSLGVEREVPVHDWIDIGVFAKAEKGSKVPLRELYLQKHKLQSKENKITIVVDEEPSRAGIDPYNKLIDRRPGDNLKNVTKEEIP